MAKKKKPRVRGAIFTYRRPCREVDSIGWEVELYGTTATIKCSIYYDTRSSANRAARRVLKLLGIEEDKD